MRFTVICAFMLALLWVEQMSPRQADAEFVPNQSPTFDMASGGDTAHQHYRFTGIVPVLNGYAGFQWTHARDGGDLSSNHLKARHRRITSLELDRRSRIRTLRQTLYDGTGQCFQWRSVG